MRRQRPWRIQALPRRNFTARNRRRPQSPCLRRWTTADHTEGTRDRGRVHRNRERISPDKIRQERKDGLTIAVGDHVFLKGMDPFFTGAQNTLKPGGGDPPL